MAIIDQTGNNGLGAVIEKNILLVSDTLANAGLTATKHANGRDWWIVVPEIVSNRYHTLLITQDTIFQLFSQPIGVVWPPFTDITSQAVFLNDGSKYLRFSDEVGLQIFDFDRCSGLFSNPELINFDFDEGYFSGLAASRSSRFVYVSDRLNLYQYDLRSTDIESTKTIIDTYDNFTNPYACDFFNPQLAPDGKIYLGTWGGCKNLHVIKHPERKGLACDFQQHGITLNTFHVGGLPNNPNYRLGPLDGSPCDTLGIDNVPLAAFRYDRDSSDMLRIEFSELADYEPETWYWAFGDGDTSWLRYPVHVYDSVGEYQACLTVTNQNGSDTYCKTIQLGVSGIWDVAMSPDDLRITPNPNNGEFLIQTADLAGSRVIVYDILGKVLVEQRVSMDAATFRVTAGLKPGTYFCRVIGADGQSRTATFVVAR
jgi:PKD domain